MSRRLEEAFKNDIFDEDIEKLRTFEDVVEYIAVKLMRNRKYCPKCDTEFTYIGNDIDGTRTGLWCKECWRVFDLSHAVIRKCRIDGRGQEWELVDGEWKNRDG